MIPPPENEEETLCRLVEFEERLYEFVVKDEEREGYIVTLALLRVLISISVSAKLSKERIVSMLKSSVDVVGRHLSDKPKADVSLN